MKNLFTILFCLITNIALAQSYDTAITILQASTMTKSAGSASGNAWLLASGYVQQAVSFPATRTYRFDFTGHGTNKAVIIKIDGIVKTSFTVNSGSINSLWSSSFSVTSGTHTVQLSTTGAANLYMGLLYIFSSNSTIPVKYPVIANTILPAFASAYISSNQIGSGKLRGYNRGKVVRPDAETLTQNDFAVAAYRGANIIRTRAEVISNGTTYSFVAHTLDSLDAYVSRANTSHIYLNIVMSDANTDEQFFGNTSLKNSYILRFSELVARYKMSKVVACFSLCNEPNVSGTLGEWCMFAQQISSAVRRIDTNHIIVMPSGVGSQDIFRLTELLPYRKVAYEYHSYLPFEFTHQGINAADNIRTEYPNTTLSPYYNAGYLGVYGKPELSATLTDQRGFSAKYNVPIIIGEFGCVDYSPNYSICRYIKDAVDLFEAEGWSWCDEAYRAYEPWDAEIPPSRWYVYSFINAFPSIPGGVGQMQQYRTDTTCTTQLLVSYFARNSTITPQLFTYYRDADDDGYGNILDTISNISQPVGYVTNHTDCDDNNAAINPAATEIYDGVDNNCDGQIDEGWQIFYKDADGDGYGDAAHDTLATFASTTYTIDNTDCNDNNALIYPGKTEVLNGIDDNCNGQIDEGCKKTRRRRF